MKTRHFIPTLLALAMLSPCALPTLAKKNKDEKPLRPRVVLAKPASITLDQKDTPERLVVKFVEGSRVRLRDGLLAMDFDTFTPEEEALLLRNQLTAGDVQAQLEQVNTILKNTSGLATSPLFSRPEDELDVERQAGQLYAGEELADLNSYFQLTTEVAPVASLLALANTLNAFQIVESVEFEIKLPPPSYDIAPATPNFMDSAPRQGYLDAAPVGIDARYAWTQGGGGGNDVRVIDVEYGWQLDHEDLRDGSEYVFTSTVASPSWVDHGTAVLGAIGADPGGYGITGIAHDAGLGVVSHQTIPVANAINLAASRLRRGDVMLLEIQVGGPRGEYVPTEYAAANFSAIRSATALGIIVVEAAGNGAADLDSPVYGGAFDPSGGRNSGAILVGAGTPDTHEHIPASNYGSRVDVQGWGAGITTLGYGDLFYPGGDPRQTYTRDFRNTSGASAIVAGAVASLQGAALARTGAPLSRDEIVSRFVSTGTPQGPATTATRHIGPLPNLRGAIDSLATSPAPLATWSPIIARATGSPSLGSDFAGRIDVHVVSNFGAPGLAFHSLQFTANSSVFRAALSWDTSRRFLGRESVVSCDDGRLEVFARGTDARIWHAWQPSVGLEFGPWASLGGSAASDPVAVRNRDGRLEFFFRATDNQIHHAFQFTPGGAWTVEGPLPTCPVALVGNPDATLDAGGRLRVFSRCADGSIRQISTTAPNGPWGSWQLVTTGATGDPVVGRFTTAGQLELYFRGRSNDLVFSQERPDRSFFPGISLGGSPAVLSKSAVVRSGSDVYVIVRRDDGTVRYNKRTGSAWDGWRNLGGSFFFDPAAARNPDGSIDVFAVRSDGTVARTRL